MKKTKTCIFVAILISILCMAVFSTTVFAGVRKNYVEPTPEATETLPTLAPLTPEGNLTLVDDLEKTDETDKQFITAVTKNGNYFYLVIDRAGKKDNVYLLNMVDEADLLALIENSPIELLVCVCNDKCELGAVKADCPVCSSNKTACVGKVNKSPELTKQVDSHLQMKENASSPIGLVALLLIVLIIGGGVFYYFKVLKNKPKTKGSIDPLEYEFDENTNGSEDESEEDSL